MPEMLKLCRVTKVKVFFLVLVYIFTFDFCHFREGSISAEGLQPVEEKINAVKGAPAPQNVSEPRSFLGMVQYYQSFLPGPYAVLGDCPLSIRLSN